MKSGKFIHGLLLASIVGFGVLGCDESSEGVDDVEASVPVAELPFAGLVLAEAPSSPQFEQAYLSAARDTYPELLGDLDPDDPANWEIVDSLLTAEQEQAPEFQDTLDIYFGGQIPVILNPSNCPPWNDPWCAAMYTASVTVSHCSGWIKCETRTRVGGECNNYPNPCTACWYTPECA